MKVLFTTTLALLFGQLILSTAYGQRIGINTTDPGYHLEIYQTSLAHGTDLRLSDLGDISFLHLYNRTKTDHNPGMYWQDGQVFRFGLGQPDGSGYMEYLRLDGQTIGVYNTGRSIFLGAQSGDNDDLTDNFNIAIGSAALFSNTDRSGLVAVGDSSLYFNGVGVSDPIEATDNTAIGGRTLLNNTIGYRNFAAGSYTLTANSEGFRNTGVGAHVLFSNTTGNYNTAVGNSAMFLNEDGEANTAIGHFTLVSNTSGSQNVAIGQSALYSNTDRSNLIAIGDSALYNNGIGATETFMARFNTAIGSKTLLSNTIGYENTAVGYQSMRDNVDGYGNTAFGFQSLKENHEGYQNGAFGTKAMYSTTNGDFNNAFGHEAMYMNTSGSFNTAMGEGTLRNNQMGHYNVAIGAGALFESTASANTVIGFAAMNSNSTGRDNVALGKNAMGYNSTGSENTTLGADAGFQGNYQSYSGCVYLGFQAGYYEGTSNRLYIENSDSSDPLIYGEFDNDLVRINGELNVRDPGFTYISIEAGNGNDAVLQLRDGTAVGADDQWTIRRDASAGGNLQWRHGNFQKLTMTPSGDLGINLINPNVALDVNGSIEYTGTLTDVSDIRFKKDIESLQPVTNAVNSIRAVSYEMRHEEFPEWNFQEGREYGVIAQELEPYFPELVKTDPEGYKSVDYTKLTVVLLKAFQEQQEQIQLQDRRLEEIQDAYNRLNSVINNLKDQMDNENQHLSEK